MFASLNPKCIDDRPSGFPARRTKLMNGIEAFADTFCLKKIKQDISDFIEVVLLGGHRNSFMWSKGLATCRLRLVAKPLGLLEKPINVASAPLAADYGGDVLELNQVFWIEEVSLST